MMLIPSLILMYLILTKQSNLDKFFSKKILDKLSVSNQYFSNKARNITMFLALIFFILALARPVTNEKIHQTTNEKTIPIVIALDVSKSMMANDIYPNRLTFAKNKLLNIIDYSKQNSIAVILFAKSSYILSPLTNDFNSLKTLINNLNTQGNFDNGTNINSVIEISNKLQKDFDSKNLLLLTDGGDEINFENQISLAKNNNMKIYTLATATSKGSAVKLENGNYLTDNNGNIVNLKLNENIKDLSLNTKGGYINFTLNNDDFKKIIDDINISSNSEVNISKKHKTYTELFYYPLAIGIILLLVANSSIPRIKRKLPLTAVIFSCFYAQNLYCFEFDFQTIKKANENYKNQDYDNAIKNFKSLEDSAQRDYNLANSYYKNGKYKDAINLYKNIEVENRDMNFKVLHNLGNAYAKNNQLENSIKAYEEALKVKNDFQTKENLELVKKIMNKQKNKNKDNHKKEQQQNKEEKQKQENKKTKSEEESKKKNEKIEKQKIMSDYEEKRWLQQIENQKNNSLLKQIKPSKNDYTTNPW
jgi:Ca-activated chloride channel family protein